MPVGVYDRKTCKQRSPCSDETKKKISLTTKGRVQTKAQREAGIINGLKRRGTHLTEEHKKSVSKGLNGHLVSEETRKNLSEATIRRYERPEERLRAREMRIGSKGSNWKGGRTSINKSLRNSLMFKLWRIDVFKRDDWTCVTCGATNGGGKRIVLHPHHIKVFADYPELRFEINNGITLCRECHGEVHNKKFGGK